MLYIYVQKFQFIIFRFLENSITSLPPFSLWNVHSSLYLMDFYSTKEHSVDRLVWQQFCSFSISHREYKEMRWLLISHIFVF